MKLLDVTEVKLEWLDLSKLTQHKPKPYEIIPGTIGTTEILRYIATTLGTLKLHAEDVEDAPWRVLLGMGWETMAAQLYADMKWPAKVMSRDGIMAHPDGWSWISGKFGGNIYTRDIVELDDALCIDEFKYTAKSLREKGAPATQFKDIRRDWMWMNQVMSYLAMRVLNNHIEGRLLARFHIMWAMGAYDSGKFTLDERYFKYLIEFEHDEVMKTWRMLQDNREGARKWLLADQRT